MSPLNCAVGDLAITVHCQFADNLGKIVRVMAPLGYEAWRGHANLVHTWQVEIACENSALFYQDEGGDIQRFKTGPVPDSYLRRLTPPQGYLFAEFTDAEQVQLELHLKDPRYQPETTQL
jgi:hypothetical protein